MSQSSIMSPGSVALVTGATSGIGLAVADAMLGAGLRVIYAGRNEQKLQEVSASSDGKAFALKLDVSKPDLAAQLQRELPDDFREIDILVASAGSDVGGRKRFDQGNVEDWASTVETNVTGLVRSCHAVIPGMLERGRGHIVTIGSIAGLYTYPGGSIYAPTKHAVHAFTDCLRKDYVDEPIRITEILPGLVRTGFAEARHKGDADMAAEFYDSYPACLSAEDIAATVMFALSQPDHVNIAQLLVTPTGDK